ncbi:MAG: hypothetical protein RI560_03400 [Natronomonas sp.]|nr:hypothetical protein [Natronomonas sp.]
MIGDPLDVEERSIVRIDAVNVYLERRIGGERSIRVELCVERRRGLKPDSENAGPGSIRAILDLSADSEEFTPRHCGENGVVERVEQRAVSRRYPVSIPWPDDRRFQEPREFRRAERAREPAVTLDDDERLRAVIG